MERMEKKERGRRTIIKSPAPPSGSSVLSM